MPRPVSEFTKMHLATLMNPAGGKDLFAHYRCMRDHWWSVTEDDCVVFWGDERSPYRSPQCNTFRNIAERFNEHIPWPIARTVLVPVGWAPINISDYMER